MRSPTAALQASYGASAHRTAPRGVGKGIRMARERVLEWTGRIGAYGTLGLRDLTPWAS